ncbi:MAG: cyclopropane-fatty-acyl-phospholipid synthase family protein [Anaeromyxobacter sp.]
MVRLLARNPEARAGQEGAVARAVRAAARLGRALRRRGGAGRPRDLRDHDELGAAFFRHMLDPTLTWSCAIFERPQATLEEASEAKLDALCRKLRLGPGDHLAELGGGFGSLAIHAARRYGCRVTTTTVSPVQHQVASERVRRAGLEGRVKVLLCDYRDLAGTYDKLVSVEMIEAVEGSAHGAFFRKCAALLKADGLMALQAVTAADGQRARREVDLLEAQVAPGACVPTVAALLDAAARASDLQLRQLEDIGPHYATTLAAWRANLARSAEAVARLATPRVRRLWEFCLCACEAGFRERLLGEVQLVLARPRAG